VSARDDSGKQIESLNERTEQLILDPHLMNIQHLLGNAMNLFDTETSEDDKAGDRTVETPEQLLSKSLPRERSLTFGNSQLHRNERSAKKKKRESLVKPLETQTQGLFEVHEQEQP